MKKLIFKVRTQEDIEGMNTPGTYLVSLVDGTTRDKGEIYPVISNSKDTSPDMLWFIGKSGKPVKISKPKWSSFKRASPEQIAEWGEKHGKI